MEGRRFVAKDLFVVILRHAEFPEHLIETSKFFRKVSELAEFKKFRMNVLRERMNRICSIDRLNPKAAKKRYWEKKYTNISKNIAQKYRDINIGRKGAPTDSY